jgi:hypothetical protein
VGGPAGAAGATGTTTGNVHWWRCPKSRSIASRCAQLPRGAARGQLPQYSLWDCICAWDEI